MDNSKDYYEVGSESIEIDEFTEALLEGITHSSKQ